MKWLAHVVSRAASPLLRPNLRPDPAESALPNSCLSPLSSSLPPCWKEKPDRSPGWNPNRLAGLWQLASSPFPFGLPLLNLFSRWPFGSSDYVSHLFLTVSPDPFILTILNYWARKTAASEWQNTRCDAALFHLNGNDCGKKKTSAANEKWVQTSWTGKALVQPPANANAREQTVS